MKSQTLQHRGTTYLLKDYKGSRSNFRAIDNLIFDARLKDEKSIEDYTLDENKKKSMSVIVKAISVYGFKPITVDMFLDDLCETIVEYFLNFNMGHLSWNEINLAVLMNSHVDLKYPSGEDYEPIISKSQSFSLQYLAQLVGRYMIFRNHLDEMIKKMFDGIQPYSQKFNN